MNRDRTNYPTFLKRAVSFSLPRSQDLAKTYALAPGNRNKCISLARLFPQSSIVTLISSELPFSSGAYIA